jgi:hypothetical protein
MCKAFSGLVLPDGKVIWEFGVDSHETLIEKAGLKDDRLGKFVRFEIRPKLGIDGKLFTGESSHPDYLRARKESDYQFILDEKETPDWFKERHERAAWRKTDF